MKFNRFVTFLVFSFFYSFVLQAQEAAPGYMITRPDGTILMAALVLPNGDTMIYCQLREIEIIAPRTFANADDFRCRTRYSLTTTD